MKYGNEFDNYEPTAEQKQEFKDDIKDKDITEKERTIAKEWIPKIVEVLHKKWKYGSGYKKQSEIVDAINFPHSAPIFRKLIQIYRENPERWNYKSIQGTPMPGYIVADRTGYLLTTDIKLINEYMTQQLDPRRRSLNKQVLGAEIQLQRCKEQHQFETMNQRQSMEELNKKLNEE